MFNWNDLNSFIALSRCSKLTLASKKLNIPLVFNPYLVQQNNPSLLGKAYRKLFGNRFSLGGPAGPLFLWINLQFPVVRDYLNTISSTSSSVSGFSTFMLSFSPST